jgi:hypothetical protein
MGWVASFDDLIRHRLVGDWPAERRLSYLANLRVLRNETSDHRAVVGSLDQLDAKASGILTHISMMITAMGVTAISEIVNHDSERFICYLTIGAYLVLAVMCLRCMSIFGAAETGPDRQKALDHLLDELIYRRGLFSLANRVTTGLTGLVIVLIYFFYFY